jgi:membrane-associated phospholipid phosphatase
MSLVEKSPIPATLLVMSLLVITLLATSLATSAAASPAPPDSARPAPSSALRADAMEHPPVPHLFTRGDLYFLGVTAGGLAIAVHNDQWLTDQAVMNQGNDSRRRVADFFQPLPVVALASAAGLYAYGRWGGHAILARRAGRGGISMLVAGGVTFGLKAAFGRFRPRESPDDPFHFEPFSGHASFPSGHTTLAFAAAVALDRETGSRWVPWVGYPAAAMVAWSRVHDLEHWTSDVVAGAAIGGLVGWKTESFLVGRSMGVSDEPRTSLFIAPRDGTLELVMARRF